MNPRARRALRWTFIVVFLLLAPAVILTTAGYRYNFGKKKFERTGVLLVDADPRDVRVYVNEKLHGTRTPLRVPRLAPGTYRVRVEKDGYWPWSESVQIESRITTFADSVTLLRANIPILETAVAPQQAVFSRDGRRVALTSASDAGLEVRVHDLRSHEETLAFRSAGSADALSVAWSPESEWLLIGASGAAPAWFIWNAERPESLIGLSATNSLPYTEAFWGQDDETLYAVRGAALFAIDPASGAVSPAGPSATAGIVTRNRYFGIEARGAAAALVRRDLSADALEAFADLPNGAYRPIPGPSSRITYASRQGQRLFTLDAFADDPASTLFEGRGQDGVWSSDGKRLLYWNDLELRVYDAERGEDALLTRLGDPPRGAAWDPRGERLAFLATDASLIAVETEDRHGRFVTDLLGHAGMAAFSPDPDGDLLHFVGTLGRQTGLWSLRLR